MHVYQVRPRKDQRGVDLISDVLPFGRLRQDFFLDMLVIGVRNSILEACQLAVFSGTLPSMEAEID